MYVLYVLFGASCARGEHVHHAYRDVLVERMEKCNAARTIIARSYRSCHQENGYSISMAMRYPWALMECGAVLPLALEVPNNVVRSARRRRHEDLASEPEGRLVRAGTWYTEGNRKAKPWNLTLTSAQP